MTAASESGSGWRSRKLVGCATLLAVLAAAFVPAATYLAFNLGRDGQNGWGVPIGTDTAFALGILSIFGTRVLASAIR